DADEWTASAPGLIEKEVRARRALMDLEPHLPIPIRCRGTGTAMGVSAGLVIQRVRQLIATAPTLFALDQHSQALEFTIRVEPTMATIDITGGHPRYLHYASDDAPDDAEYTVDQAAMAVVSMAAFALSQTNALSITAEFLSKLVESSDFLS